MYKRGWWYGNHVCETCKKQFISVGSSGKVSIDPNTLQIITIHNRIWKPS